jgi:LuxR family maltose regulon positive regulatory protein
MLRQYLESYDRPYMLVQLNLLEAVYHYRAGSEAWRERMQEALGLAKRYGLVRVIADEGMAVIDMLNELSLPDGPWEAAVLSLCRRQAANYPNYMKQVTNKPVFTDREYQVYSLMIAGYRNAKIASILNIKERTVKYFCGLIYQKLGVTTRAEALRRAAELGDIR